MTGVKFTSSSYDKLITTLYYILWTYFTTICNFKKMNKTLTCLYFWRYMIYYLPGYNCTLADTSMERTLVPGKYSKLRTSCCWFKNKAIQIHLTPVEVVLNMLNCELTSLQSTFIPSAANILSCVTNSMHKMYENEHWLK